MFDEVVAGSGGGSTHITFAAQGDAPVSSAEAGPAAAADMMSVSSPSEGGSMRPPSPKARGRSSGRFPAQEAGMQPRDEKKTSTITSISSAMRSASPLKVPRVNSGSKQSSGRCSESYSPGPKAHRTTDTIQSLTPESGSPVRQVSPPRASRKKDRSDTSCSAPETHRRRRHSDDAGRGRILSRLRSLEDPECDPRRRRPSGCSSYSWLPNVNRDRMASGFRAWRIEKVFPDADEMRMKVRQSILVESNSARDLYKTKGLCQYIVRSSWFEWLTLLVIGFNAIWIAVDADFNRAMTLMDADWPFQVAEHSFTTFFLVEWILRFTALRFKVDSVVDRWFLFDSFLVLMMVTETWLMTIAMSLSGFSQTTALKSTSLLRLIRLFRIMRLSRMVRLMRALPELIFMIRGMMAATRSVFITMVLLFCILYAFGVAFRQLSDGTDMGEEYFGTVIQSMYTLLIAGTLLDNVTFTVADIGRDSRFCAILFFVVILLAALTVMNMLIGVTCEVVSAVARTEKERSQVSYVKERMWHALWQTQVSDLDADQDGMISKEEFRQLIESPEAFKALRDVGVDVVAMVDLAELIFQSDAQGKEYERKLNFHEFMDVVLQLRGGNPATVKDIVDLRRFLHLENTTRANTLARMEERQKHFESRMESLEKKIDKLVKHGEEAANRRARDISPEGRRRAVIDDLRSFSQDRRRNRRASDESPPKSHKEAQPVMKGVLSEPLGTVRRGRRRGRGELREGHRAGTSASDFAKGVDSEPPDVLLPKATTLSVVEEASGAVSKSSSAMSSLPVHLHAPSGIEATMPKLERLQQSRAAEAARSSSPASSPSRSRAADSPEREGHQARTHKADSPECGEDQADCQDRDRTTTPGMLS